jgi:iron complex outermembrane recepter protein
MKRLIPSFIVVSALCGATAGAQEADLTHLSLADLLDVEVTSVSRKEQPLSRTAAAVHVITQEDIERSGARTIPDLLRMAPGFNVAQIDANGWAVGSRGFGALYASKLLVLVDGRSVYTPLFAGVHWDMLNVPLEDIERIEVIRGPGGTLWGANAVNGVVNIITKPAAATRGGRARGVTAGARGGEVEARYGAALGDRVDFRVFGRGLQRDSASFSGIDAPDRGRIDGGGGRLDWRRSDIESVTVQGFVQKGRTSRVYPTEAGYVARADDFEESNVMLSWNRSPSSRSETAVQFYFDAYNTGPTSTWQIADVDGRHRRMFGRHEVVAGAGFRTWTNDEAGFTPERETSRLVHAFIQDEIQIAKNLYLTPGSKFEHNSYTGFEIQPSVRALWRPVPRHSVWTAASRAVRTPSRANRGVRIAFPMMTSAGVPVTVNLFGNPEIESERLRGLEAGYRIQLGTASVDVSAFRNGYDRLQSAEPIVDPSVPSNPLVLNMRMGNGLEGTSSGVEVAATWIPSPRVRFFGNYSYLTLDIVNSPGSLDFLSKTAESNSAPNNQLHGRVYVDLPYRLNASALAWRIGAIEGFGIDAYTRLDLRLGWTATRRLDLALSAHNLLHDATTEFLDIAGTQALPIRRQVAAEVRWKF